MLGKGAQDELNEYKDAQIEALRVKYQELGNKCDEAIKLIGRTEKTFNANHSLDNDQNIESDILSDIFYSWKEIFDKKG